MFWCWQRRLRQLINRVPIASSAVYIHLTLFGRDRCLSTWPSPTTRYFFDRVQIKTTPKKVTVFAQRNIVISLLAYDAYFILIQMVGHPLIRQSSLINKWTSVKLSVLPARSPRRGHPSIFFPTRICVCIVCGPTSKLFDILVFF